MQNKNKKQLQHSLRRAHEQAAASLIILGMLAGTVAISQEIRRAVSEIALHPVMAVIEHSNRETETAHRAMRLDSVLRATPISGD